MGKPLRSILLQLFTILIWLAACSTPVYPAPEGYYLTSSPGNRISRKIHEVEAGESIRLFANKGRYLDPEYMQVDVSSWTVSPIKEVSIDGEGVLTTGVDVPHQTRLTVMAHTKYGVITDDVLVYSLAQNPLVGAWKEVNQPNCGAPDLIEELEFLAGGRFNVTWHPFEFNVDYYGNYSFDLDERSLTFLDVQESSNLPTDLEVSAGAFYIDDQSRLILEDMHLGNGGDFPCEHYIFERR